MGSRGRANGFSLVEILVVLALIGLTLFITVPRFGAGLAVDPALRASRWIMISVEKLKRKATLDQQLHTLHLDIPGNRLWISRGEETPQGTPAVVAGGLELESGVGLMDVEYPQRRKVTQGIARIRFYPQGYSDRAIIHLEGEGGRRFSFQVEPFLAQAKLSKHYTGFKE